jgi:hypothetical protein
MRTSILLRWLAAAVLGGYGTYTLISSLLYMRVLPGVDRTFYWFFLLPLVLVYCGLFIAAAIFILRRQNRHLCALISALVAVVVFGVLMTLPAKLGLLDRLYEWSGASPWAIVIALPGSLAALFIPFYAARWSFRRGQVLLLRLSHEAS